MIDIFLLSLCFIAVNFIFEFRNQKKKDSKPKDDLESK